MTKGPPDHYIRLRRNGAVVFLVDKETPHRRTEMTQIAVITQKGEVKPHGSRNLTPKDMAAIDQWLSARAATLKRRDQDEIARTIEALNLTASWAQTEASDADLDAVTDDLLMAMNDLRQVLIRKLAARLPEAQD